jgi:hypothetical protein
MGPNPMDPADAQTQGLETPEKVVPDIAYVTVTEEATSDVFVTPSPTNLHHNQLDPDLLPVAPALILNALALTPLERSRSTSRISGRTPVIQKKSSWIQNENVLPLDGFISIDPTFYSYSTSVKFPKPVWPKSSPTIPTSFYKDHRSKKKVGFGTLSLLFEFQIASSRV